MAAVTYLDTHVVVWLYAGRLDLVPPSAAARLEQDDLLVSPAVRLEVQYLHEIGRIRVPPGEVFPYLEASVGLGVCDLPFSRIVTAALGHSWTRDPFDRLIVAQAAVRGATLLTRDEQIRARYPKATW
jgi:PIN domain nuclease of toxin-antitoxin system